MFYLLVLPDYSSVAQDKHSWYVTAFSDDTSWWWKERSRVRSHFLPLPCYEICIIIVTSITHKREWKNTLFDNMTHIHAHQKTTNVTTSRNQYICTYTYYCTHLIIQIISMFQFHAKLLNSNNIIKCFKL